MKFVLATLCCFVSLCGAEQRVSYKPRSPSFYRGSPSDANSVQGERIKPVQNSINTLTLNLNRILTKCSTEEKNVLFSPINIVKTMAVVMLGSGGSTELELANAIGPTLMGRPLNKVLSEFHEGMGRLMRNIASQPGADGSSLDTASGIFVDNDYPIKQWYRSRANKIYGTEVSALNFSRDGFASADYINKWIDRKTRGTIKEIIPPPVDATTKVIFADALYFNGNWEHPFEEKITKWQTFYLGAEGKYGKEGSVFVEMLVNQAKIPAYDNKQLGFQAIGMPYKGGDTIMYVILPKLKTSLPQLMCNLTPEHIRDVISKSQLAEVFYVIPKMKLNYESNLRDVMIQLNATSMFSPQTANFTNLSDVNGVYVSDIIHKVNVETNEKGTIAAAATAVTVHRGGYVNFRAERPFIFFIYNIKLGIITFWGNVKKPIPFRTELTPN